MKFHSIPGWHGFRILFWSTHIYTVY